jgi:hypothetical protein
MQPNALLAWQSFMMQKVGVTPPLRGTGTGGQRWAPAAYHCRSQDTKARGGHQWAAGGRAPHPSRGRGGDTACADTLPKPTPQISQELMAQGPIAGTEEAAKAGI